MLAATAEFSAVLAAEKLLVMRGVVVVGVVVVAFHS
jgi:hypothetical protein